jgi:putative protein kinase ArgK-like GTPase of G3E family
LVAALESHRAWLEATGELEALRRARLAQHTREVVERALSTFVWEKHEGERVLQAGLDDVVSGRMSPYRLASDIVSVLQEEL